MTTNKVLKKRWEGLQLRKCSAFILWVIFKPFFFLFLRLMEEKRCFLSGQETTEEVTASEASSRGWKADVRLRLKRCTRWCWSHTRCSHSAAPPGRCRTAPRPARSRAGSPSAGGSGCRCKPAGGSRQREAPGRVSAAAQV